MTNTRPALRPDARLVHLHAERGDPQARLAEALAHLEEADWGYLFAGEVALARQLVAMFGPGTLRVDGRIPLERSAFAEAGLAIADLHGDLHGARAAWLFEPDQRTIERACRANVPIVVDGTLAPGGGWPSQGAQFVVYRNAVTLTGHADVQLSALFGMGQQPVAIAPSPSDLSVAMTLRDVATLPLRLARIARTITLLTDRFAGKVRTAGPTALLLPPDALADTLTPLGGVLAALQHVPEGLLLTPGLEDSETVMHLLQTDEMERATAKLQQDNAQFLSQQDSALKATKDAGELREGRKSRSTPIRFASTSAQANPDTAPSRPNKADRPEKAHYAKSTRKSKRKLKHKEISLPNKSLQQPEDNLERFTFEAPEVDEVADISATVSEEHMSEVSDSADLTEQATEEAKEPAVSDQQTDPVKQTTNNTASVDEQSSSLEETKETKDVVDNEPSEAPPIKQLKPDLPGGKEDPAADLSEEQAAIFARLREWRNAEAKRQEISRFIIASNATLAEIARRVPYTREDLGEVRGMGPGRMAKYGEKILELVRG